MADVAFRVAELNINGEYTFPQLDGAASEVLQTDGLGTLTFQPAAGGGTMSSFDLAGDTGPVQTIVNADTLTIQNAPGGSIKTVAGGGGADTVTIDIAVSGVTPGSYTSSDITVNNQGLITAASSGAGGGGGPSLGSNQSVQCTWAGATQQWLCVNEANFGWSTGYTMDASTDLRWSNTGDTGGPVAYYPIYFPEDITIDYVSVIGGSSGGTIDFAIFASDADNFPTGAQLLAWQITLVSATYTHQETSVAATAFTKGLHFLALEASSSLQYLLGNFAANFCQNTVSSSGFKNGTSVTPFCNYSDNLDSVTAVPTDAFSYFLVEQAATTIPATITLGDLVVGGKRRDGTDVRGMIIPALFVRSST